MKIYAEDKQYRLYEGQMQEVLDTLPENSVDAIICDPPYELGFMGKSWDSSGVAFQKETWEHCLRVLKDGGYLLAFGGTRTFHRMACAIEDAGFEIRDTLMWLYGSGFPKSTNVGRAVDKKNGVESEIVGYEKHTIPDKSDKNAENEIYSKLGAQRIPNPIYKANNEWNGWGTCLKPAYEPIIMARKPFKGSLVDNVIENGVGGLNIEDCRVGNEVRTQFSGKGTNGNVYFEFKQDNAHFETVSGRFPANIITDGGDEVASGMPTENDVSAMRYFYCAKASKKDRDGGLDMFEEHAITDGRTKPIDNAFNRGETKKHNIHPTVKPCELMQYLIRLVAPKGSVVMDCFMGSGSTGKATMFENRERNANYYFIGIEMTSEYLPICKARIDYAINPDEYEAKKLSSITNKQVNVFDD